MSAFHFVYMAPPSQTLREYAAELYVRRAEAVVAPRQAIAVGDWQPQPNLCHENAMALAEKDGTYTAVHGWLFFDLVAPAQFKRFAAHSVVATANGQLIDVTPAAPGVALYPFIRSGLTEEDYADAVNVLIQAFGSSNCLDHWVG